MRLGSLCLTLGFLGTSCAYHLVQPGVGDGRVIHVSVTENDTRWRGIEVASTDSLREELVSQLDLQLGTARAHDLQLRSRFVEVDRRTNIGNRQGGFSVGTARIRLDWELVAADGEILSQGTILRELEFLTGSDETLSSATAEIVEDMAEQIVLELGVDLGSVPTRQR